MTSPETIHQTIAMLRQRVAEINRLIERFERERKGPHVVQKAVARRPRPASSRPASQAASA